MSENFTSVTKIYDINDNTKVACYEVVKNEVTFYVPHDTANRHYQEILEWVAEGNTITDNGGGE